MKIDVNNTYIIRQAGSSQSTVLPAYEMNGCRHTDTAPPFVRDHVGSLWRTRQSPKEGMPDPFASDGAGIADAAAAVEHHFPAQPKHC